MKQQIEPGNAFNYSPDGFSLNIKGTNRFYRWHDIEETKAYKRDLITIDHLCLDISFEKVVLSISEDLPGWPEFINRMEIMLTGVLSEWERQVIATPFANNETIIYKRQHFARNGR